MFLALFSFLVWPLIESPNGHHKISRIADGRQSIRKEIHPCLAYLIKSAIEGLSVDVGQRQTNASSDCRTAII